jgi:biopolymer transport protein TolR
MAGGSKLSGEDDAISEINVTPFVDVALVLLVIFMVTAGMMVRQGVKIELPQAATAETLASQQSLNILVTVDGQIVLDGELVEKEALQQKGKEALEKGKGVVAMISADKGVVYSYVVGVMDALRMVGVNDFALQLEPLPASARTDVDAAVPPGP